MPKIIVLLTAVIAAVLAAGSANGGSGPDFTAAVTSHAEDHYRVIGFLGKNALLTEETTPLEPGVVDHKLYVRGTGTALERTVKVATS